MADALKRLRGTASPAGAAARTSSQSVDEDKILKQGTMRKQGGEYKSWKERWFILTKESLAYYKKKEDPVPIKAIPASEMILCRKEVAVADARRYPFYFSVETGIRTYLISTRTEVERNEWVEAIQSLITSNSKSAAADLKHELEQSKVDATEEVKPVPWVKRSRDATSAVSVKQDFDMKPFAAHLRVLVRNEALSDLILTLGGERVFCHRAILAARCTSLLKATSSGIDPKAGQAMVSLDGQVSSMDALHRALDFIYTDEVEITPANVIEVLQAATALELTRLQQLCRVFVRDHVDVNNALVMLKAANKLQITDMETFLLYYMKDVQRYTAIIKQPEALQIAEENKALYVTMSQVLAAPEDKLNVDLTTVQVDEPRLRRDLETLLTTLQFADVRIITKDGSLFAHRIILQAHCPIFMDEGLLGVEDNQRTTPLGKTQILKFPTLSADVIQTMLQALYSNSVTLDNLDDAYGLIELADRVIQENVVSVCDEMMRRNLNKDTALKILMVASEYELIPLKKEALALIVKQAPDILKRKELRQVLSQWPWNLLDIIRSLVRNNDDSHVVTDEDDLEDNDQGAESDEDKPITSAAKAS